MFGYERVKRSWWIRFLALAFGKKLVVTDGHYSMMFSYWRGTYYLIHVWSER